MPTPTQLDFPYPSLDWPGRSTVGTRELAERTGLSPMHFRRLVDAGELVALDTAVRTAGRSYYTIPMEEWHAFVLRRMTGNPSENEFLQMSTEHLESLLKVIGTRLKIRGARDRHLAQLLSLHL